MELLSKVTFHTYQDGSLFSLDATGIGDVLDVGNPSNDKDTQKGKCEDMVCKCLVFHKELVYL